MGLPIMKRSGSKPLLTSIFAVRGDVRGVTAVEFAMLAPLLVALFISIFDLGLGIYTNTQLAAAAQYGGGYAVQNGYNATSISTAVKTATALQGLTVTPAEFCGCPSSSGVTSTSCTATCSDGLAAGTFAQVSVAKDYTTIFPYPGLPAVFHLNQEATVRLQ